MILINFNKEPLIKWEVQTSNKKESKMEQLTRHHLERIRSLSRHALRTLEAHTTPRKGEKGVPLDLDTLTTDLLLIRENVRMVTKIERIESEAGEEAEEASAA